MEVTVFYTRIINQQAGLPTIPISQTHCGQQYCLLHQCHYAEGCQHMGSDLVFNPI